MKDDTITQVLNKWGVSGDTVKRILGFLKGPLTTGRKDLFVSPLVPKDLKVTEEVYTRLIDYEQAWLQPYSMKEMEKFQPRSNVPPFASYERDLIDDWVKPKPFDVDAEMRRRAVDLVIEQLRGPKLRTPLVTNVVDTIERSTNSGSFYFQKRGKLLDDVNIFRELLRRVREWDQGVHLGQYILTTRAKESRRPDPTRARPVHMSSLVDTLAGARIQRPLIGRMKKVSAFPSAVGPAQDDVMTARVLSNSQGSPILSGDISGFDVSVGPEKFRELQQILNSIFDSNAHGMIERVIASCTQGETLTPNGLLPPHDTTIMASGWVLTNAGDSIINLVDITYNMLMNGVNVWDGKKPGPIVNGDDFVVILRDVPVEKYAEVSLTHGMLVHPDKQTIETDMVVFNQRYSHSESLGESFRSVGRHAWTGTFPERIHDIGEEGQALTAIARLHLMETSKSYKALLTQEVEWDEKLKLGAIRKDVLKRITSRNVVKKVRESLRLDQVGVPVSLTLKGINSWKVVQDIANMIQ